MATSSFSNDDDDGLMTEINMTPLVDVMLVLLIVFMVTIPVLNHAVKVNLPQATSQPQDLQPTHIDVSVQADGTVFWNKQPMTPEQVKAAIATAASQAPQPEIHLYADRAVRYEAVADLMSEIQANGLSKIGFVTQPATQP
ncbi:ExbD/TolR family protein [Pararobbsia silviterrae]|uniref:Biopolymer transporter ExbD n=1 Tax=Pararobbsia silviterrae TaxID=1792498 RepID=A0A494X7S4_9BURK|nr:biopolymer transporter ExbD [Pararobbsia silviterrae]RKP46608.1 biopolymer transporter ExbD [Pararobbsia silviterrae]